MSDKKQEEGSDYQYDETSSEYVDEESNATEEASMPRASGASGLVDKLKNRKVIAVIVFIIIVIVVYNFLGGKKATHFQSDQYNQITQRQAHPSLVAKAPVQRNFNSNVQSEQQMPEPQAAPVQQTSTSPVKLKAQTLKALVKKLTSEVTMRTENQVNAYRSAFNARVNTLQQQALQANEKISNLNNQLTSLQSQLATLHKKYEHIKGVQDALAQGQGYSFNASGTLTTGTGKVIKASAENAGQTKSSGVVSSQYTLQAVIPGRAWLKAPNGMTITVDNGSVVPGYGHVTSIDAMDGVVSTTSGKQITTGE